MGRARAIPRRARLIASSRSSRDAPRHDSSVWLGRRVCYATRPSAVQGAAQLHAAALLRLRAAPPAHYSAHGEIFLLLLP